MVEVVRVVVEFRSSGRGWLRWSGWGGVQVIWWPATSLLCPFHIYLTISHVALRRPNRKRIADNFDSLRVAALARWWMG